MVKEWRYGDAGDRWPVQVGDVWRVGDHILGCGDLEEGAAVELLSKCGVPDITYTDPPWNAGNAASFRTKAGLPRKVDFHHLLGRVIEAVKWTRGDAFIEMGRQNTPLLRDAVEAAGGRVLKEWCVTYTCGRRRPSKLLRVTWAGGEGAPVGDATGMDDSKTPAWALSQYQAPLTVFDPCLGRGLTAVSAHRLGHRVVGMELHPRRLACAIDALVKLGTGQPERVGALGSQHMIHGTGASMMHRRPEGE